MKNPLYNFESEAKSLGMVRYIPKDTKEQNILDQKSFTVFVLENDQHNKIREDLIDLLTNRSF